MFRPQCVKDHLVIETDQFDGSAEQAGAVVQSGAARVESRIEKAVGGGGRASTRREGNRAMIAFSRAHLPRCIVPPRCARPHRSIFSAMQPRKKSKGAAEE